MARAVSVGSALTVLAGAVAHAPQAEAYASFGSTARRMEKP